MNLKKPEDLARLTRSCDRERWKKNERMKLSAFVKRVCAHGISEIIEDKAYVSDGWFLVASRGLTPYSDIHRVLHSLGVDVPAHPSDMVQGVEYHSDKAHVILIAAGRTNDGLVVANTIFVVHPDEATRVDSEENFCAVPSNPTDPRKMN